MPLILIDYSIEYYTQQNLSLPSLRQGKFVLLRHLAEARRYGLFAPYEMANYHANIVAHFCQKHDIAGTYNKKKDMFEVWDDAWQVEGGGRWRLDTHTQSLALFATSIAYGGLDLPALAAELLAIQAFNKAKVVVE